MNRNSISIKQVKNGYVVTAKSKCTYLIEEHVFSTFNEVVEFMTYYLDEADLFAENVNLVISNKKEKNALRAK